MIFADSINVNFNNMLDNINIPNMYKIIRKFECDEIEDIENHTLLEIENALKNTDLQNKRIAITAGSRGITKIDVILKTIGDFLKKKGAKPFIVTAMGSHAGAVAEGQKNMLKKLGISEETTGLPVLSSMDVNHIGTLNCGVKIYCDKVACESDGIIVINKIKPHADFKGMIESGLCKMMCIGLGKHKGATEFHNMGFASFKNIIEEGGNVFIKNTNILCGVGIVENMHDKPMIIEAIKPENIIEREKELLKIAKENVPQIGVGDIDVLIIDEIGKNISGEGMDPNVTGRPGSFLNEGFIDVNIDKIVVLGITEQSGGNGAGIGMADITTIDCIKKLDLGLMYTNSITAGILAPSTLPIILNSTEEAIKTAMKICSNTDKNNLKIVKIKNTLDLEEIFVSEKIVENLKNFKYANISIDNIGNIL